MEFNLSGRPCPLCGTGYKETNIKRLLDQRFETLGKDYVISECLNCGLIHQNPRWDEKFYDGLYSDHLYDPTGHKLFPAQVERYRAVAEEMEKLIGKGGNILDYGCHDGSFIEWLRQNAAWTKNAEILGYDISLRGVPPDSIFYNSLADLKKTGKKFDLVTFNHVVEHLYNPIDVLKTIAADFLPDGGRVLIEVPDISHIMPEDFSPFHIQHLNYFSPKTMADLLTRTELAVESINTYVNYDSGRDPYFPTLLAIGRRGAHYNLLGNDLVKFVAKKRKEIKDKIESKFGREFSFAVAACGDTLYPFINIFSEAKLVGLFDNDKKLWGREAFGIKIQPVPEAKNCDPDVIVVCTLNRHNAEQISKQLSEYVDRKKILTFFD